MFASIREFLDKFPVTLLLAGYLAYLGYDYYGFMNDEGSPFQAKKAEQKQKQAEVDGLHRKIKEINEFSRTLDAKRQELRNFAQELEQTKAALPETLEVPELMKTILFEARRAGLTVVGLRPMDMKNGDFYAEQGFQLDSTGIYFQFMDFFDRVANLQKIIKVDSFVFTPSTTGTDTKYVVLQAAVQFKAYKYIGTKADDIAKGAVSTSQKPKGAGS